MSTSIKWPTFILALSLIGPAALARSEDLPDFDELRTPASPAFVLLGVEPATVERPTTPKDFATTLFSAVEDSDDLIPKNFALEAAPFWLGTSAQKNLTFKGYHEKPRFGPDTWIQNLSVSLATTVDKDDKGDDSKESGDKTGVGFGFRTTLLWGDKPHGFNAATGALYAIDREINDLVHQMVLAEKQKTPTASLDEINARIAPTLNSMRGTKLMAATKEVERVEGLRTGWNVDFAGAVSGVFPDSSVSKSQFSRFGLWVTPTYRYSPVEAGSGDADDITLIERFELGLVSRFIHDRDGESESLLDFGGRLTFKYSPLTVAVEGAYRVGLDGGESGDTNRVVGILEYEVWEGKFLTASFGQDFDDSDGDRLVTILGVNVGFGDSWLPL